MKIDRSEFQFQFARSSGSGGQNVNKVNTKAILSWDIDASLCISDPIKERFKLKFSRYINKSGMVQISSERYRSQAHNIEDCIEKLLKMLEQVKSAPKKRIETKPTKASKEKRIKIKKTKSDIKNNRKKVSF